jgi:hypothetical protein
MLKQQGDVGEGMGLLRTRYGEPSSTGCAGTSSWILHGSLVTEIDRWEFETYWPFRLLVGEQSIVSGLSIKRIEVGFRIFASNFDVVGLSLTLNWEGRRWSDSQG